MQPCPAQLEMELLDKISQLGETITSKNLQQVLISYNRSEKYI